MYYNCKPELMYALGLIPVYVYISRLGLDIRSRCKCTQVLDMTNLMPLHVITITSIGFQLFNKSIIEK